MDASTDSLLSGLSLDGERCSKSVLEKKAALAEPKRFVEDELLPKAKAWEEKMTPSMSKRQLVLAEFAIVQAKHWTKMRILNKYFRAELESLCEQYSEGSKQYHINKHQIARMFNNSYRVQLANEEFVAMLFEALESYTEEAPLSHLFYYDTYWSENRTYLLKNDIAIATYDECLKSNERFRTWVSSQDRQPFIFERQRMKEMLTATFQNNIHVANIAERLQKATPPEHSDYEAMTKAHEFSKKVSSDNVVMITLSKSNDRLNEFSETESLIKSLLTQVENVPAIIIGKTPKITFDCLAYIPSMPQSNGLNTFMSGNDSSLASEERILEAAREKCTTDVRILLYEEAVVVAKFKSKSKDDRLTCVQSYKPDELVIANEFTIKSAVPRRRISITAEVAREAAAEDIAFVMVTKKAERPMVLRAKGTQRDDFENFLARLKETVQLAWDKAQGKRLARQPSSAGESDRSPNDDDGVVAFDNSIDSTDLCRQPSIASRHSTETTETSNSVELQTFDQFNSSVEEIATRLEQRRQMEKLKRKSSDDLLRRKSSEELTSATPDVASPSSKSAKRVQRITLRRGQLKSGEATPNGRSAQDRRRGMNRVKSGGELNARRESEDPGFMENEPRISEEEEAAFQAATKQQRSKTDGSGGVRGFFNTLSRGLSRESGLETPPDAQSEDSNEGSTPHKSVSVKRGKSRLGFGLLRLNSKDGLAQSVIEEVPSPASSAEVLPFVSSPSQDHRSPQGTFTAISPDVANKGIQESVKRATQQRGMAVRRVRPSSRERSGCTDLIMRRPGSHHWLADGHDVPLVGQRRSRSYPMFEDEVLTGERCEELLHPQMLQNEISQAMKVLLGVSPHDDIVIEMKIAFAGPNAGAHSNTSGKPFGRSVSHDPTSSRAITATTDDDMLSRWAAVSVPVTGCMSIGSQASLAEFSRSTDFMRSKSLPEPQPGMASPRPEPYSPRSQRRIPSVVGAIEVLGRADSQGRGVTGDGVVGSPRGGHRTASIGAAALPLPYTSPKGSPTIQRKESGSAASSPKPSRPAPPPRNRPAATEIAPSSSVWSTGHSVLKHAPGSPSRPPPPPRARPANTFSSSGETLQQSPTAKASGSPAPQRPTTGPLRPHQTPPVSAGLMAELLANSSASSPGTPRLKGMFSKLESKEAPSSPYGDVQRSVSMSSATRSPMPPGRRVGKEAMSPSM